MSYCCNLLVIHLKLVLDQNIFLFFYTIFIGHMSIFGAPDTPILDLWRRLFLVKWWETTSGAGLGIRVLGLSLDSP